MAISGEQVYAEMMALRVAVRQLLKIAQQAAIGGEFAKNALEMGLAELGDTSLWAGTEGFEDALIVDSRRYYRDLFTGL